jgi:hypothetical protein
MSDRKDDPQEKDPIDDLLELAQLRLQKMTNEEDRKSQEELLDALRSIRAFNQERKNASPEEKARYALLDELDQIKKQRAEGRVSREEALYLIARLILPEAIRSAEVDFSSVASLWSAIEKVREFTISDDEYLQWEEVLNKANLSFDKIERNIQKLVAGEFYRLREPELADLYKNDPSEFFRLYEEGKKIAARSTGPC